MIGFGDVVMGLRYGGAGYFGFPLYYPEKTGTPEEVKADGRKSRQMEARQHLGRFNVMFVDNHVERSKPEWLFAATDEGMSRWNNDHQPHRDDLYNWGEQTSLAEGRTPDVADGNEKSGWLSRRGVECPQLTR